MKSAGRAIVQDYGTVEEKNTARAAVRLIYNTLEKQPSGTLFLARYTIMCIALLLICAHMYFDSCI